jgi:hypothetical protein
MSAYFHLMTAVAIITAEIKLYNAAMHENTSSPLK